MTLRRVTIVETNAQGGLIHFAYQMADALSQEGVDVTLVTGSDYELDDLPHNFAVEKSLRLWPTFDRVARNRSPDVTGSAFRYFRRVWRGGLFFAAWTRVTIRLLRDRPDGVVLSMIHTPFQVIFFLALKWAGIPTIQVCHEIEQRDRKSSLWESIILQPLLSACYRSFSLVVFLARSVETSFKQRFGDDTPTTVMQHGPQLLFPKTQSHPEVLRTRYGVRQGERVILFFGLLRPSKGVADLVDAFARLPSRSGLRLVVAGYPTKSFNIEELHELIEALGLQDQVSLYLGYVPNGDVAALMEMADLVVFPYRNATASGAVSAAQSLGRPIVATSVGGLPEAISDGVTGLLVPPGDPEALAGAIAESLANPDHAVEMAEAGRQELMENRSWRSFARGLTESFEKLHA